MSAEQKQDGVRARVAIVDPADATVLWSSDPDIVPGSALSDFLPMAESLGVNESLSSVAESGEPRHLHTDVVSMSRGSISLVVSIHRLPDNNVLVISEHGWQASQREGGVSGGRPRRR